MSKLHVVATFMLLVSLSIVSCKKDHHDDDAACSNNTGWLKNGHEFVYVNDPIFIFADTLYITTEEVSTGVFKSTSKYDDGTLYPVLSNYLQACGNSIYQAATPDLANKQEIYRIDGAVGDSWSSVTTSTGGNTITSTTTITAKNVVITVPAGTFTCIQFHQVSVSSAGGSVETDLYLENNAGIVLADGSSVHYELARKNY